MSGLKYCKYCNSSISATWDGSNNYRKGICSDCAKNKVEGKGRFATSE